MVKILQPHRVTIFVLLLIKLVHQEADHLINHTLMNQSEVFQLNAQLLKQIT